MKKILKKIIPVKIRIALRSVMTRYSLAIMMHQQANRFFRSYAREYSRKLPILETRVMYFMHQIEKGLSHKDFRYGFGKQALLNLSQSMSALLAVEPYAYSKNETYRMALAALNEYIQRHKAADYDLSDAKKCFSETIWREAEQFDDSQGGSYIIDGADKQGNGLKSFSQLANERHAVREFSDQPVDIQEIQSAVDLARTAPSVCNRQPARVHVTCDVAIIKRALAVQGGLHGYPTPPALILITADNQSFLCPEERNEGFVDGGLFSMQLLMSLEAAGLAACPLNTMMNKEKEEATREIMQVPDNEFLVMYIAVGHFPETIHLCRSSRCAVEKIMSVVR